MNKILYPVDRLLNNITMYRVVLYALIILSAQAFLFSALGILSYKLTGLLASLVILFVTCYGTNFLWSKVLKVATNVESSTITAFILFFVFSPSLRISNLQSLVLAGVIAMSSKYILALNKKHIFNPVAITAVILGALSIGSATWWVGSSVLIPLTVILGLLVVRKIQRFSLFFSFLIPAVIAIYVMGLSLGTTVQEIALQILTSWPIFFFGTIMLTEPLTTPPRLKLQMIYGVLVGILFGSQFHVGPFYSTPELALVVGNIFSYIVGPKLRLILTLKQKNQLAATVCEFVFDTKQKYTFLPGQYMEWTFPHAKPDSRGNRRYFTIASSPTEPEIKLGLKFYENSSTYKKALLNFQAGGMMVASQLAGDFTMPKDTTRKLVFIAGGIGVTPFRSMIKYLIDTNEKRDVVLFFANRTEEEIVYKDIFDEAQQKLNIKTVYVLSEEDKVPANWTGKVGRINMDMIKSEVPDHMNRTYYISGPHGMVTAYEEVLSSVGIKKDQIKSDFFPGFA